MLAGGGGAPPPARTGGDLAAFGAAGALAAMAGSGLGAGAAALGLGAFTASGLGPRLLIDGGLERKYWCWGKTVLGARPLSPGLHDMISMHQL